MKKFLHSAALLLILTAPLTSAASVLITELMYDLEGADSGYEWIEITNTGSNPVDIGAWRLFEQGVNHKLTLVAGASTVLQPEQSAIVADKPEHFLARYPEIVQVFDSAFSLSNESETLMLKNSAGRVVDQVTYRSTLGAKGDGGSLHLEGEVLTPALPNPGVYPGKPLPIVKAKESEGKKPSISSTATSALYAAAAVAPRTDKTLGLLPWLVGLLSIIGIGVVGALLVKTEQKKEETKSLAEEFEIIENP